MRQLATVKRITSVADIPGKDRIGLATIDGWTVIVQKSEFKPDDLCIFCEIDSLLPDAEWCSFLKDHHIRTMKMAGCISQGICFTMDILPDGDYYEGDDVTEILDITKWERPDASDVKEGSLQSKTPNKNYPKWLMRYKWFRQLVYKFGDHRGSKAFPDFLSKTDETRIQNAPFYLDLDVTWLLTEKLDGQSGSFAVKKTHKLFGKKYEYIVCSRNVRLYTKDDSSYWKVSDKYNIEEALTSIAKEYNLEWVAVQGECVGPKVQGNKYKLKEPDLFVFNFITCDHGRWPSADGKRISEEHGLKWVPVVGLGSIPNTVEKMLELAHGPSQIGDTIREGLVCRSLDGKHSFKAVDPEFLIKYHE